MSRTNWGRARPISAIIRTAEGKRIGRVLRLERLTVAYDYAGRIGKFDTERQAIRAIRAKHEARR